MSSERTALGANEITVQRLREEDTSLLSSFSCAGKDEEDFLRKDAWAHQKLRMSETFLLIENKGHKLVSYITLSFGSFKISENEPLGGVPIREKRTHIFSNHSPCLLIGKLGTDRREEGRGGGTLLIDFAVQLGAKIDSILALPFLALHAHADKVPYYRKRGFLVAFTPQKMDADTITMYRHLMEGVNERV